jgi:iron complex outermembrane recepter protein
VTIRQINTATSGVAALALLPLAAAIAQETRDPDVVLPEIIVTADPIGGRTVDELIQPIHALAQEGLERRRAGTLGEILDGLPGVANADFGPGVGRPVIRGLQGSRVEMLQDGLRAADVSGEGADHAIAIDPAHAVQIEVFRGPAVLLYGSGAAGGMVNVRTRRYDPVSAQRTSLDGEFSYGENGSDRQSRLAVEVPAGESFVFRADASQRRSGDFSIKGFQQEDQTEGNRDRLRISSISSDSYSMTGVFRGDWGHLGLGLSTWQTDYGVPENFDARPRALGGQEDEFERIEASYDRVDLRGEFLAPFAGISSLRLKVSYTEFEQEEIEYEFDRTPEGGVLDEVEEEAEFRNDELEARLDFVHVPIGGWRGAVSLHFGDRDFFADVPEEEDETFYVRPNRTRTMAWSILEERPTAFGRVELAARAERVRSAPEDVFGSQIDGVTLPGSEFLALPEQLDRRSFTPVSVSAGTIVDISGRHHLRLGLTSAQRAPSPEQLYAFGRHAAAGTFEVGDPDLRKETYQNFELGFDRHVGSARYDLSLFYNRVDDFIFLRSEDDGTGNPVMVNDIGNRAGEGATIGCAPGDGGLCRLRNELVFNSQRDASFYGFEFGAAVDLGSRTGSNTLRLSADHVRGTLRGAGDLPRITPARAGVGYDTSFGPIGLSVDYRRVFKQTRIGVAEDETGGFNLVSFDLSWQPATADGLRVFLRGRNLLNEDGRLHQSFFKNEAPIIGRALTAGVRFELGR